LLNVSEEYDILKDCINLSSPLALQMARSNESVATFARDRLLLFPPCGTFLRSALMIPSLDLSEKDGKLELLFEWTLSSTGPGLEGMSRIDRKTTGLAGNRASTLPVSKLLRVATPIPSLSMDKYAGGVSCR
jgi:hypothetical protein